MLEVSNLNGLDPQSIRWLRDFLRERAAEDI
jgi:hypothetical protein